MPMLAFTPGAASSGTIAATETNQRIALVGQGANLYLYNNSDSVEIFIATGGSTVTAVAGDAVTGTHGGMCVGPRAYFVMGLGNFATNLAAICAAGQTATLRFSRGDGE